jgi:SOS-response transcriptional repressor LexA
MRTPTKAQREVVEFIKKFVRETGYSPSLQDISSGLKYQSVSNAHRHVWNLRKEGVLKPVGRSQARSIEFTAEYLAKDVSSPLATLEQLRLESCSANDLIRLLDALRMHEDRIASALESVRADTVLAHRRSA